MNHIELETQVWTKGICASCGACAAVCPARTIVINGLKPLYEGHCREDEGIPCGACYDSCARIKEPGQLKVMENIVAARSVRDVAFAQSGGAVTALLASALENGMIDGAVVLDTNRLTKEARSILVTDSKELMKASGSRYSWGNALEVLGDAVKQGYQRLAVVGTPCAIQSIRKMMGSDIDVVRCYGRCVVLTVGLFCSSIFNDIEGAISGILDISSQDIMRIEISGKIKVLTDTGWEVIPISSVKDSILPGCAHCTDFSARYADISAGDTGSKQGFTTLIVRTPAGQSAMQMALRSNRLEISTDVDPQAIIIKENERSCVR